MTMAVSISVTMAVDRDKDNCRNHSNGRDNLPQAKCSSNFVEHHITEENL